MACKRLTEQSRCGSMLDTAAAAWAIGSVVPVAVGFWLVSLVRNDVSIVDALWSLMFLLILTVYVLLAEALDSRTWLVLSLVTIWALRLSVHIAHRNRGEPEDHRYREIRRNNEPHFRFKSLYIVFGLQAALASFIAVPLLVAVSGPSVLGWFDGIGVGLWLLGMFFEVTGDYQLASFKAEERSRGKVLDTGLWRFTRHPNYFGEFAIWWGYFFFALAAGGWWTVLSPLLMSILLLKVSGVALLERSISQRRPDYAEYVRKTNAFFPGPPRVSV
jgi:steroid 5-alpha reductase family enzyme